MVDSFDLDNNMFIRVDSPHQLGKSAAEYETYTHSTMNFNQKLNHQFEMFQSKVYSANNEGAANL